MNHESRWRELFQELGASAPEPEVLASIRRQYAESHRAYHTMQHIDECLAWLDRVREAAVKPAEVELAIWMHDVVYDPHRTDNEKASGEQARQLLEQHEVAPEAVARIVDLILATKHDRVPPTDDAALLVDIDLSILAAEQPRFDEYERQVREEYAWVERDRFREARCGVLQSFLDRKKIYATPSFFDLERPARENLSRSIHNLS